MTRVSALAAMSLDGLVIGLHELPSDHVGAQLDDALRTAGCVLTDAATWGAAVEQGADASVGRRAVVVASTRPLDPRGARVITASGHIAGMVAHAREAAGDRDVLLLGGELVGRVVRAGALDAITVTIVPTVLGHGTALFGGISSPAEFEMARLDRLESGLASMRLHRTTTARAPQRPRRSHFATAT